MKKNQVVYLLIVPLFLLIGCVFSKTNTYVGESENWSAKVILHQASGKESEDIILKYKGKNFDDVGEFKYYIDAPGWGTGQGGVKLNKVGVYKNEGGSLNEKKTSENAQLEVKIEWNNVSETVSLKK